MEGPLPAPDGYDAHREDRRGRHAAHPSGSSDHEGRNRSCAVSGRCGVTVDQFQRLPSVVEYPRASLMKVLPEVRTLGIPTRQAGAGAGR